MDRDYPEQDIRATNLVAGSKALVNNNKVSETIDNQNRTFALIEQLRDRLRNVLDEQPSKPQAERPEYNHINVVVSNSYVVNDELQQIINELVN